MKSIKPVLMVIVAFFFSGVALVSPYSFIRGHDLTMGAAACLVIQPDMSKMISRHEQEISKHPEENTVEHGERDRRPIGHK